ncbi:MAG: alpha-amylase family glycosyl hydrolase [Leptolyngbyaceae bacterium]|nr:alpha-amylase family glycosyl hydrolase [Leptolyngbyaceae bacterium]
MLVEPDLPRAKSSFAEYEKATLSNYPACSLEDWHSGYLPNYLTHITQVFEDGKADICAIVYLPAVIEDTPQRSIEYVQVRLARGQWQNLKPSPEDPELWTLELKRVPEGSRLLFRYRNIGGQWRSIAPLNNGESLYGATYIPCLRYEWKYASPTYDHATVLMETTLEGLLGGYKNGRFAPRSLNEIYYRSIAARIVDTDMLGQLSAQGIDEIMVPVCSSVANRATLNPKFNYLTYNFVDVDWQIGQAQEFKQLLDSCNQQGLRLIPDLIFAHQVKSPFEGSLDSVSGADQQMFVDEGAFLFRDYGTWMLNLEQPNTRRMLIEKFVTFVMRYRLQVVRIDYVDGLILQYSNRETNYGELFIQELRAELKRACPDVLALGETFEMAGNEAVKAFIDSFYAPIGFSILEELYKPPTQSDHPLSADVQVFAEHIKQVLTSDRDEAYYAQLHDETWYCPHVAQGRPTVPWAYGKQPAQLAKDHGEALIQLGLLEPQQLLDYVRRMVRNAEALTMFLATKRYMFTPGVDALSLGCLDDPEQWKVAWDGVSDNALRVWLDTGLSSRDVFQFHEQHRQDMVNLRNIFRTYTKVNPATDQALVTPYVHHVNQDSALLCLLRHCSDPLEASLLVVFNFGPTVFEGDQCYEMPLPIGFAGDWTVLFDGDGMNHSPHEQQAYAPGTRLEKSMGVFSNQANVLRLRIGARSLLVLKYSFE